MIGGAQSADREVSSERQPPVAVPLDRLGPGEGRDPSAHRPGSQGRIQDPPASGWAWPDIERDRRAHLHALDAELRRQARLESLGRRVLGKLALRWCETRAHRQLGLARMGDYVKSFFGMSRSAFAELAKIGRRLDALPVIDQAFLAARITWSKLEILVAIATPETEADLVAFVEHATVRRLEQALRVAKAACVDTQQVAHGRRSCVDTDPHPPSAGPPCEKERDSPAEPWETFSTRVVPRVRAKFECAIELCRRLSNEHLPRWRAVDWIAADFLSGVCPRHGSIWSEKLENYDWKQGLKDKSPLAPLFQRGEQDEQFPPFGERGSEQSPLFGERRSGGISDVDDLYEFARRDLEETSELWRSLDWTAPDIELPPEIAALADGLDAIGPHDLHERIVQVLQYLQRVESETAPLVRRLHTSGGAVAPDFFDHRHYLEQRAGLPARAFWRFAQLNKWARRSPALAEAFAEGKIHREHAKEIDRVLEDIPEQPWIQRAQETHLPRFEHEITSALCGHLESVGRSTQVSLIWFRAPESVIWHWNAALAEAEHLAPPGASAVELVLDSFLNQPLEKLRSEHKIFERDGWTCQAPGCTSRRDLHAHHIRFRSDGGDDAGENLTVTCAACHLHGIHEGRLTVTGEAPDGVAWEIGCRPDGPPLRVFRP